MFKVAEYAALSYRAEKNQIKKSTIFSFKGPLLQSKNKQSKVMVSAFCMSSNVGQYL